MVLDSSKIVLCFCMISLLFSSTSLALTYDFYDVIPAMPLLKNDERNPGSLFLPPDPVPPGSITYWPPVAGLVSFYFPSVTKMSSIRSFNCSMTRFGL
jgi:hypothetical protein